MNTKPRNWAKRCGSGLSSRTSGFIQPRGLRMYLYTKAKAGTFSAEPMPITRATNAARTGRFKNKRQYTQRNDHELICF